MGENITTDALAEGLARAMARTGRGRPDGLRRLTGGATMESWRFSADGEGFVLRRAPSLAFMEGRPFGHDVEAAVIRAAHGAGVTAPEVVVELEPGDGIGSGFVMRALPGTPDPRAILAMDDPDRLLREVAGDLARIHSLGASGLPDTIPTLDYAEGVAGLREQFEEAGGDRAIIALGLKWLEDHLPEPVRPVLNHGDYRLGNILADDSHLTGVLDWELAHFGDPHEDLAFGCMAVWRFARYDRPALGLGSLEEYFAAYEAAGGAPVDRERFRFWSVYRTVWWALGCLRMADFWRSGEDRMLERLVISRRASEQELDLLLLLEDEAPEACKGRQKWAAIERPDDTDGDASEEELLTAVSEWLGTIKDQVTGHDKFQLAVARNALGMVIRNEKYLPTLHSDPRRAQDILDGTQTLATPGLLGHLRQAALEVITVNSPKYPALAEALEKWTLPRED
ncbi:phosphotransferase [Erythrobacter litoralis]|uniref:Tyrosine protein kinase:Aminoglycoside phosphotransferase n=1 Tax=Erythrobacter litoralis (strain HTCC2594) TaxID=314225 RepID=Q2N5S9_ERYLH|nr:phosphotransferase [Erythrobacter litoralis]ABC64962.1 Tyrosine protein kinase:Aminoglycoside phosphotransferase [Erythrobacter litoralis HTCC2594]